MRQLEDAKVTRLRVPREYVYGKVLAHDVVNTDTGEITSVVNSLCSDRHTIIQPSSGLCPI